VLAKETETRGETPGFAFLPPKLGHIVARCAALTSTNWRRFDICDVEPPRYLLHNHA